MRNYLDEFQQTSKAILFEKFVETDVDGGQVPCLRRFLTEKDVTSDRFYKRVTDELGVKSFDEFVYKFSPWIYEIISEGEDGEAEITYSLEKPKGYDQTGMSPIALNATALYEMVNKIYNQRKESGEPQIKFDYSGINALLSPEAQNKKLKTARHDMQARIEEYYRLEEENPGVPSAEKENAKEMFNKGRIIMSEVYKKGPSALISTEVSDASAMLLEMRSNKNSVGGQGNTSVTGLPYYDENGDLKFKPAEQLNEDDGNDRIEMKVDPEEKMTQIIYKDYKKTAPDYVKNNKEVTNMILSNLTTKIARTELEERKWVVRLEKSQQKYKRWTENLSKVIDSLIEKFIGVKTFFENATVNGELESILIVANSTAEELVDETVKEHLSSFLSKISEKRKEKIWFGIIPAVALGDERSKIIGEDEPDDFGEIEDLMDVKTQKVKGLVNARDAKSLLLICEKAKIMTFYNFKANSNTCFGKTQKQTYDNIKTKIELEDGSFAVCCLPNFTIIPEEETHVVINEELCEKGIQDKKVVIDIPSVYVEASYVAAGMMVGLQQSEMLREKEIDYDKKLTNIRVDLEWRNIYLKFQSNMSLENLLPPSKEIITDVNESRFGFFFSEAEISGEKGKKITHCFVKNARTMHKNEADDYKYEEISHVLFKEFVEALLYDDNPGAADPEFVKDFIVNDIEKWTDYAQSPKIVNNALLRPGEQIIIKDNQVDILFAHKKSSFKLKLKSN